MRHHAEAGPILNEQKSRLLRDDIYEFKTTQGARLLYFYTLDRRTMLTNGFQKGDNLDAAIRRAKDMRSAWEETEQ